MFWYIFKMNGKFIIPLFLLSFIAPSVLYACPGCAQAIAESGGTNGLIAIYSLLAGMPFLIIGSIALSIVIMKHKSDEENDNFSNSNSDLNGRK